MPLPSDARGRELLKGGRRELAARFDAELGLVGQESDTGVWHSPRDSLWYALCLLLLDGDATAAERIVRQVLSMQERRDGDPHRGNFRWFAEHEAVTDLNAVAFVLEGLTHILHHAPGMLSDETMREVRASMLPAFEEVERLDVHWTYTNIYLLDVHNSILAGEALGENAIAQRGYRRLRDWAERTKADGAPHEFNSGTYSAVQTNALAAIAQLTADGEARALALEMEAFLWRHIARHFHAPTLQLGGPHSRAYRRDVVGAPDFLKVLLYKLLGERRLLAATPYYDGPGREGSVVVGLTEYHCPPDALELLTTAGTHEVRECADREAGMELTTFMTPRYVLGSMSRPYGVGEPPEGWPGHNACILYYTLPREPAYGVLYCRYVVNDHRVGEFVYASSQEARDLWEEGTFRTAQRRNGAIVAYGLLPRGQRPLHSLRLDVRVMDPDGRARIVAGGEAVEPEAGASFDGARAFAIEDGDVYIGVRPLEPTRLGHEPPLRVWRDGRETVVSVSNYRGPPKSFWEYRSLSGPFYRGNVKNDFVLRVAEGAEYASLEAFAAAFEREPLDDTLEGSMRRITFGAGGDALSLAYDLRSMWP